MNTFITNNDQDIEIGGSCLQGYIEVSFAKLVETFGEPSDNYDDYKSDAEWQIEFENGVRATVYNYKNGINYCGTSGTPVKDITDWNVGGYNKQAVEMVMEALGL